MSVTAAPLLLSTKCRVTHQCNAFSQAEFTSLLFVNKAEQRMKTETVLFCFWIESSFSLHKTHDIQQQSAGNLELAITI